MEIRSDDISIETAGRRRVCIRFADIETGVPAQVVAELSQVLVSQTEIEGQGGPHAIIVLCESGNFPGSELTVPKGEHIGRGIDVAEGAASIAGGVEAEQKIRPAETDVQHLSHRLHSSKLEYLGLEAASAAFCREVSEQQNVKVHFHAVEVPEHLPNEVSLCLFRVLQEALHNALKHSGVSEFEVSLRGTSDDLQLIVHDSGVGFDAKGSVIGKGLGLTSMKQRLKLVDGQLVIESKPQQGTNIVAQVPVASGIPAV